MVSLPYSLIFFLKDQCYSKSDLLASCRASLLSISKFTYVLVGISAMVCIEKNDSQRDSPNSFILQMRSQKPSHPG